MSVLYNLVMALSNLSALYFANYAFGQHAFSVWRFEYVPMIASGLYHLAETKNQLPGVYPLNRYTALLLNLDRLAAVFSAFVILACNPSITLTFVGLVVVAFLALALSEINVILYALHEFNLKYDKSYNLDYPKGKPLNKNVFVVTHCVWHVLAFLILSMVLNQK
jgi:hypothetical protein